MTSETIGCDLLASCSTVLGWFLRPNRGVQTHQAPGQAAASNCRRAWNRFDSAASTLILQRF
ncbi:hypothetical protein SynA1544_02722 [Synechococcus sp. A15-44]|nr:hypothetical protein SynA1544_02722 [Synechococcus sp. A15-44]